MATQNIPSTPTPNTVSILKGYFNDEQCKANLAKMLGSKAQGFATSVLSVVNNNTLLQKANPKTIYSSAMIAASLDLPINPSLGFAAIVPYGNEAQFQIMTRGLIQLAIRSGQYARITNAIVHKGELVKYDPFKDEYEFDASKKESDEVVGFMAYFRTNNGYEKYYYMTKEEAMAHGKQYSKSFNKENSLWRKTPDAMCLKTVLKLLLSKFGILSIEMQRAIKFDQGVPQDLTVMENPIDIDEADVEYVDNNDTQELDEDKAKQVADMFNGFSE